MVYELASYLAYSFSAGDYGGIYLDSFYCCIYINDLRDYLAKINICKVWSQ